MIQKLLIANRGEIASRIIRTCKKMNIETVAVFSEADRDAKFVEEADESYLLGPAQAQKSYLNIDKIIEIAKKAKVDAIHPGYGFMSENHMFASRCKDEDIIFIGPEPEVLQKMGDKITARKMMKEAGVPVIEGTEEAVDLEAAISVAKKIGYPIMLKAASGGGGIGLQVVHDEEQLKQTFESNAKRAQSFFGDGAMFIEKLIPRARHIEIQVLADHDGNVVHLFERECSIQRRNQKVIEEAPSSFLSDKTRQVMGEMALQAVKRIGYTNAGTIEFLVDEDENFYFLEMNTRIQVEHPITEEITGIDLVEAQIEIAQGKQLTYLENDIKMEGHAIEARIYAEDPNNFYPSPGTITTYEEPNNANLRIESSVRTGSEVTPFYDPMIAKLIATGNTRDEAIVSLKEGLLQYKIDGIKTNIPMLLKVLEHEQFKAGKITTNFVNENI